MKQPFDQHGLGQGVIEYAGALIIASVLVSTTIIMGPEGISGLFNTIYDQAAQALIAYLPT